MKKISISFLLSLVLLASVPFGVNNVSAADLSLKDFVNLLVLAGVIPVDKLPAINIFLANIENQNNTSQNISKPMTVSVPSTLSISQPKITRISSKANDDFHIYPGDSFAIEGSNLAGNSVESTYAYFANNGKDNAVITQIDDNLIWAKSPSDLKPGSSYYLYVSNEKGVSNGVKIKIYDNNSLVSDDYSDVKISLPSLDFKSGQSYTLSWTGGSSSIDSYAVYLVGGALGDNDSILLGTAYPRADGKTGTFSWTIPSTVETSKGYEIQLSGKYVSGGNSEPFTILQ